MHSRYNGRGRLAVFAGAVATAAACDVHQDDVGGQPPRLAHRLAPIAGLAHHR